jgi:hypothetical protein
MRIRTVALIAGLLPVLATAGMAAPEKPGASRTQAPIDVVFAIDCSGSMGGVIETAKQKVWDIVNEVARAKPTPHLRIGLLAYGDADRTFRKYDLSDDLDTVYANLMKFKDEGWGDEYVGMAVSKSLNEMSWAKLDNSAASLRVIYVVGNETAKQGPIDYGKAAKSALKNDVFVNAIDCGSEGGQETWQEMASLGGGKYLEIAGDGGSVLIATPYDKELATLNGRLNKTYLGYGINAPAAALNQAAQDANAASVGGGYSASARTAAKASSQYRNSQWDLVDALADKQVDLGKMKTEDLPKEMQSMTPQQRQDYIAKKANERKQVQQQILTVDKKRQAYIQTEMKKRGKTNSLDVAVRSLVRGQATKNGFRF